ncbi:MAG: hypothetical protein ACTSYA_05815 [Candidatus Kariarchaeaceae archaeon]
MSFKDLHDALSNFWNKPPKSGFLFHDKLDDLHLAGLTINSVLITPSLSHSAIGKAINDKHDLILTLFPLSYSSGNPMRDQAFILMKDIIENKLLLYSLDPSWMLDFQGGLKLFAQFLGSEESSIVSTSSGKRAGLVGMFPHIYDDFISSLSKVCPLIIGKSRDTTKEKLAVLFHTPFLSDDYLTNDELKEVLRTNKIKVLVSSVMNETLTMTCFETGTSFLFVPLYSIINVLARKLTQLISLELPKWTIAFLPEKRVDISVLASNEVI